MNVERANSEFNISFIMGYNVVVRGWKYYNSLYNFRAMMEYQQLLSAICCTTCLKNMS